MTAKQRKKAKRDWLKYFGWDTDSRCLVFMDTGEPVGSLELGAAIWIARQREHERNNADSVHTERCHAFWERGLDCEHIPPEHAKLYRDGVPDDWGQF